MDNTHIQSFWYLLWKEFKKHKAALVGLFIILAFASLALLAPLLGAWLDLDPYKQNALKRYQQAGTRLELSSSEKEAWLEAWKNQYPTLWSELQISLANLPEYTWSSAEDVPYEWIEKAKAERLVILEQLPDKLQQTLQGVKHELDSYHPLGTDELGRDVLARLLYGARVSLGVALLVALSSSLIGLIVGAIAGYYGGFWDSVLMRLTDALLSLPLMPVLIVMSSLSLQKLPLVGSVVSAQDEGLWKLVLILVSFSWMGVARLVRAEVLSLKQREFIWAAKIIGARDLRIFIRHLVPNVLASVLVAVTLGIGESIQFEAALSFLGLGIQQPTPSWGNMLFNAQEIILESPLLALLPGLCILTVTIAFNYVGDGLQKALNPRARQR